MLRRLRSLLFERVLRSVFACTAAKDHGVGDGVAAEAVEAVHAARHFTCGIEAGHRTGLDVEDLAFGRDGHAAHRVMDARATATA